METTSLPSAERRTAEAAANHDPGCDAPQTVHGVSVVVPVYQGESTLGPLVGEIESLTRPQRTPQGNLFQVTEVILVHDGAVDGSAGVMEALVDRYPFVRLIWLARNFGQHPATLAGMASTASEWIATIDEDGEHDPADIGRLLDKAFETGSQLVYAAPTNPPPHGWLRNLLSTLVKRFLVYLLVGNLAVSRFHSFRLVHGEIARSLAAYCGHNVYLDVALSWIVARSAHCPVWLRQGGRRRSGYNFHRLFSHLWRLVLTSGTKPLRFVSLLGLGSVFLSMVICLYALWEWQIGKVPVQGWTSLTILLCFFSGSILFSLGVVTEYLGMVLSVAVGRPLYLVVSRPVGLAKATARDPGAAAPSLGSKAAAVRETAGSAGG